MRCGRERRLNFGLAGKQTQPAYLHERPDSARPDERRVSREQTEIAAAFVTSGWYMADRRTLLSSSHMWQAFSIKTEYAAAPRIGTAVSWRTAGPGI